MKLLISPSSSFARKARVVLREADLMSGVEEVEVSTSPLSSAPEVLAVNPLGKIPALIRDDGPAIYDSRVITRYLDTLAGAGLYPEPRLWEVLTLEATADAIMEAGLAVTYEGRFRAEELQSKDWMEAQWAKAAQGIAAIEARWLSHLSGPLDAAQIAVGCALGYLDLRHDARGWRGGAPGLATWYEAFAQRPAMIATAPA